MIATVPEFPFSRMSQAEFPDTLFRDNCAVDDARLASDLGNFAARLETMCSHLEGTLDLFDRYREEDPNSPPEITGLSGPSDNELFHQITLCTELGEKAIDEVAALEEIVTVLERIKRSSNVWSARTESLLQRLHRLDESVRWLRKVARHWVELIAVEFERRRGGGHGLPFEPIDLGPSNSARLPPVL